MSHSALKKKRFSRTRPGLGQALRRESFTKVDTNKFGRPSYLLVSNANGSRHNRSLITFLNVIRRNKMYFLQILHAYNM